MTTIDNEGKKTNRQKTNRLDSSFVFLLNLLRQKIQGEDDESSKLGERVHLATVVLLGF